MKRLLPLLIVLCVALCAACAPATAPATTEPPVTTEESVTSEAPTEASITSDDPAIETEVLTMPDDPTTVPTEATTAPTEATTKPTTATTTVKTTAKPTTRSPYSENAIEFYGRFKKSADGWQFDWSGSAIEAGFEGTGIELQMGLKGGKDYFNIYIDGGEPTVLEITPKNDYYMLASGLKKGYHTVRVEKRTEGGQGGICEFCGFTAKGGKLTKAPARPARKIEVYGDSLTVGQGIEGTFGDLTFHVNEENAALTYGMQVAKDLGASCTVIGQGGIGIHTNYAGDTGNVISSMYDRVLFHDTKTTWDFAEEPDVVLICLGTNDATAHVSAADQTNAYLAFIDALRKHYAHATIVLFSGAISSGNYTAITDTVKTLNDEGDDRVFCTYCTYPEDVQKGTADVIGGFGHPNGKANRLVADQLTEYIREIMNW